MRSVKARITQTKTEQSKIEITFFFCPFFYEILTILKRKESFKRVNQCQIRPEHAFCHMHLLLYAEMLQTPCAKTCMYIW